MLTVERDGVVVGQSPDQPYALGTPVDVGDPFVALDVAAQEPRLGAHEGRYAVCSWTQQNVAYYQESPPFVPLPAPPVVVPPEPPIVIVPPEPEPGPEPPEPPVTPPVEPPIVPIPPEPSGPEDPMIAGTFALRHPRTQLYLGIDGHPNREAEDRAIADASARVPPLSPDEIAAIGRTAAWPVYSDRQAAGGWEHCQVYQNPDGSHSIEYPPVDERPQRTLTISPDGWFESRDGGARGLWECGFANVQPEAGGPTWFYRREGAVLVGLLEVVPQ